MGVRIGIKYCGGCCPRYERAEAVKFIQNALSNEAEFIPFSAEGVDIYLVVCGCKTMCADVSFVKDGIAKYITSREDAEEFIDFVRKFSRG